MTVGAIMQPTYLPWLGYFDLMDRVDTFVLLDTVQFSHQSWQQRNRIRSAEGLQWLTVPVVRKGHHDLMIRDVVIADARFARAHIRAIELAYSRAPFFGEYFEPLAGEIRAGAATGKLAVLTSGLIRWIASSLGVTTPLATSSELGDVGGRGERLASLCRAVGADVYLSPLGAAEYLQAERSTFDDAGVTVELQGYEHPSYAQVYEPFLPQAAAIDLLFNAGPRALHVLRTGRRDPEALVA
jgi:hypothetical protein